MQHHARRAAIQRVFRGVRRRSAASELRAVSLLLGIQRVEPSLGPECVTGTASNHRAAAAREAVERARVQTKNRSHIVRGSDLPAHRRPLDAADEARSYALDAAARLTADETLAQLRECM